MNDYDRYGDYAQHSYEGSSTGVALSTAITCLLVGAGVGAAAALLFSPGSGRELRDSITRRYRWTIHGITQRAQDIRDRGSELLDHGSNLLGFNNRTGGNSRNYSRG